MLSDADITNLLFEVTLEREELEDYDQEIFELFRLCGNETEVEVVKHLINELHLPSLDQLPAKLNAMAKIARDLLGDGESLAIVAMAYDGAADGSQTIVQLLKPKLARSKGHKIFNAVPQYLRKGGIDKYPRFLLVDDFIGSGQTVLNRLKEIESNAKGRGQATEAHVCLLYGMENAYNTLVDNGHNVHVLNVMKAGLSGHYSGEELSERVAAMKRLEALLAPEIEGKVMPSLGYNSAEATFCIKDANAPNSNFPIFWWPVDVDGKDRETLMVRAEL